MILLRGCLFLVGFSWAVCLSGDWVKKEGGGEAVIGGHTSAENACVVCARDISWQLDDGTGLDYWTGRLDYWTGLTARMTAVMVMVMVMVMIMAVAVVIAESGKAGWWSPRLAGGLRGEKKKPPPYVTIHACLGRQTEPSQTDSQPDRQTDSQPDSQTASQPTSQTDRHRQAGIRGERHGHMPCAYVQEYMHGTYTHTHTQSV